MQNTSTSHGLSGVSHDGPGNMLAPEASSAPLGVVPEKAALSHQIRRTVPAQYWGLSLASAAAPDGAIASSVSEPAPLPLLAGSGLSRPHLVLATQAVKLPGRPSLPGMPSLCKDQGGLVLDRVLAHGGGDSWWATLSGRARLGRLVAHRADLLAAAADPSSYSICATSRVQLSRSAVLRSRLDWCPQAAPVLPRACRSAAAGSAAVAATAEAAPRSGAAVAAADWASASPVSLSCQLQSRVGRWAEARADLAVGHRTAGGAAPPIGGAGRLGNGGGIQEQPPTVGMAATTPLLLGLQAGSVVASRAPLVWRCGLLQVTAPPTMSLPGAAGGMDAELPGAGPTLQSAVFVQGTIALQGERVLWQGPRVPLRRQRRTDTTGGSGAAAATAGGAAGSGVAAVPGPATVASGTHPPAPPPRSGAIHQGPRVFVGVEKVGSYTAAHGSGDGEEGTDDDDIAPPAAVAAASGGAVGKSVRQARVEGAGGGGGGVAVAAGDGSAGAPFGVALPSAGEVHEALAGVTQSFSRLRDDLTAATQWVGGGGLAEQLAAVAAGSPGAAPKRQTVPRHQKQQERLPDGAAVQVPWSAFVGEPHVKVAGVVGLTARAPVVLLNHGSPTPGGGGGSLRAMHLAWMHDLGLRRLLRRRGRNAGGGKAAADLDDGGAAACGRGALRPFVSAAASVQAGRFTAWLLDFTRVSAQLDCGLWGSAAAVGGVASQRHQQQQQRHPAFALGDTGAWHALSLSLSQQLVGPLRFVADWRYELASSRPLALPPPPPAAAVGAAPEAPPPPGAAALRAAAAAGGWASSAAGAVAGHTVGLRPQLIEAVYALDLSVPGSRGAARLVAWYAPQRREGMVELRMF